MFKNYFLTAWRNIWNNKVFSFINITGLSLGIICSLLIYLWVNDEMSYDNFHTNNNRLFRVIERQHYAGQRIDATPSTPGLLAESLQKEIPEIQDASSLSWQSPMLMQVKDKSLRFEGRYASSNFFKLFSFPVLAGNAQTALGTPDGLMISKKVAIALFGNINVIGKPIRVDNSGELMIKAVFDDIPENSSLQFDYLGPYEVYKKKQDWILDWGNNGPRTFVLLKPNTVVEKLDAKIENFVKGKNKEANVTLFLQPFSDSYLYSKFVNGFVDGGRIEYVRVFILVAIVVLLIACINFMNLSTARSLKRAREIGVRKVIGARRINLLLQFMGEAFLISFFAMFLAIIAVKMLLPSFNELTQKHIALSFSQLRFWVMSGSVLITTTILSGIYPSFYLSSLKPIGVLKGILKFRPMQVFFRKGLVVTQFAMSVVLIISMMVVFFQMKYIRNKDLGYEKENLVIMPLEKDMYPNFQAFKEEMLSSTTISSLSLASQPPGEIEMSTGGVFWPGKPQNEVILFPFELGDYNYLNTLGIQLKEGRNFSPAFGSDSLAVILNEEAVRKMKIKDPLGKTITFWQKPHTIIGIVKDFHLTSMHDVIEPFILHLAPELASTKYMLIKISAGKTTEALATLEKANKKYNPAYPFEFEFLDKVFERQYKSEMLVESLTKYFAGLAIMIACMGLLGLTIFTIEQRAKEVSIRKILGAGMSSIIGLLSRDFLMLIIIAFIVATPVAFYFMNNWLHDFAYHISLTWWMFCVAGMAVFLIAFFTIGFQAIKTALENPVKNLRAE